MGPPTGIGALVNKNTFKGEVLIQKGGLLEGGH